MGGTSTDISVIAGGSVLETTEGKIAGQDIGTPMLKVRTLGAGGGTIAAIGKDGLLKVGPRSAGAAPGPACYGKGGAEAHRHRRQSRARRAVGATSRSPGGCGSTARRRGARSRRLGAGLGLDAIAAAKGVLRIVNTQMAVDLRLALQEQGQDRAQIRARRVRRRRAAPCRRAGAKRRHSDRAGAALSRHQLRDGDAADCGAAFVPALGGGRAEPLSRGAHGASCSPRSKPTRSPRRARKVLGRSG